MKLPPFDLVAPRTLSHALTLLSDRSKAPIPLAGGQTLLPLLASGAVEASAVVDLGRIDREEGLHGVVRDAEGARIGALTTHAELERAAPFLVLREAAGKIGNAAVRTRGTIGGSIAAASPSAEWCVSAVALDAVVHIASTEVARQASALALYDNAAGRLRAGELVTAVWMRAPVTAGMTGHRDRVDGTSTVVVSAVVDSGGGMGLALRVAVGGVGSTPLLAEVGLEKTDMVGVEGVSHRAAREAVRRLDLASQADGLVSALAHRSIERMRA